MSHAKALNTALEENTGSVTFGGESNVSMMACSIVGPKTFEKLHE